MNIILERTSLNRMTDMYVLRFPKYKTKIVPFTKGDFEKAFPEIVLQRGEKIIVKMDLTLAAPEV